MKERKGDERVMKRKKGDERITNVSGSEWRKRCMRITERNGLQVVWGMRMAGRNQDERKWIVTREGRVGAEWDVRK